MDTPALGDFVRCWLRFGLAKGHGPDDLTALLRREFVEARGWVAAADFERGCGLCALLPGPRSVLLAAYLCWRLYGWRGGAGAAALLVLPGAGALLGLSWLAAAGSGWPPVAGALRGLGGAAVAMAALALWRMARRSLSHPLLYGFALASFLMGFSLHLKFRGIVIAAGLMGLWLGSARPEIFCPAGAAPSDGAEPGLSGWRHSGRVAAALAACWLAVWLPVRLAAGPDCLAPRLMSFATQAGLFAYGGALPVLSHVWDGALRFGWTGGGAVAQGLGLAGAAPGPLFLAAQHVGFLAAWGHAGGLAPLLAGALGGLFISLGLLLPGFALLAAGAPFAARLAANTWLRSALTGINAALVGVVLRLCLAFGLAVILPGGWAGGGPDFLALGVACLAGLALWRGRVGALGVAWAAALAGAAWSLF
jgi:chromate transporter